MNPVASQSIAANNRPPALCRRLVACTAECVTRIDSRSGFPAGRRVDVLKNALKAANHKIEELHAALQVALASPRTYLSEEHRIFRYFALYCLQTENLCVASYTLSGTVSACQMI